MNHSRFSARPRLKNCQVVVKLELTKSQPSTQDNNHTRRMTKIIDDNKYTTITEPDVYVSLNAHEAPLYSPDCNDNNNNNNKNGAARHGPLVTTRRTVTTTHIPPPIFKPNVAQMKKDRIQAQTLGGWVGGAIGFVVLFIPGAIIGAIAGNKITKHCLKQKETKAQKEYEYQVSLWNGMQESTTVMPRQQSSGAKAL